MKTSRLHFAALIAVIIYAAACSGDMMGGHHSSRADMDQLFIQGMIPHHVDATDMAKMALEKSQKDEIKKLSAEIIKAQESEIAMMKKWHKEWYGTDVSALKKGNVSMGHGMSMNMSMMLMDLKELEKASDFDKKFLEMMVDHHKMAVMMSGMIIDSRREEMRKLAKEISVAQSDEIEAMIQWYIKWYGAW